MAGEGSHWDLSFPWWLKHGREDENGFVLQAVVCKLGDTYQRNVGDTLPRSCLEAFLKSSRANCSLISDRGVMPWTPHRHHMEPEATCEVSDSSKPQSHFWGRRTGSSRHPSQRP